MRRPHHLISDVAFLISAGMYEEARYLLPNSCAGCTEHALFAG